jgi:hypothetical protein
VLKSTCNCVIINTEARVFNLLKHPVAERQRTLKTRARQFQAGKLAWVKALSNKYQRTKDLGLKLYRGALGNRLLKWSKKLEDRTISGIRGKLKSVKWTG